MQLTNLFGTQQQGLPQQEQTQPSDGTSDKAPALSNMANSFFCKCEKPPPQCELVCDPSQRGVDDVVPAFFDDLVRLPRQAELLNGLTAASPSSTAIPGPSPRPETLAPRQETSTPQQETLAPQLETSDPRQATSADVAADGYAGQATDTGNQEPEPEPIYEGDRVDGQPEGHGTMQYPNGDFYEGQWAGGAKHGEGVFHQAATMQGGSATTYRGEWRNGLKHGIGVETWADGTRYEGEFREGEVHGCGAMIFPSGMVRRIVNGAVAA